MIKNNYKKGYMKKGFTLVEVLVAMFIFVVIATASSGAFVNFINAEKKAKNTQTNLENAQYIMSIMTKTIRTSSVVSSTKNNNLVVYDYSQGKCIQYNLTDHKLRARSVSADDKDSCDSLNGVSYANLIDSYVKNVRFLVTESKGQPNPVAGRVTISMEVCSTDNCSGVGNGRANLQTTVSLRDYVVSGISR